MTTLAERSVQMLPLLAVRIIESDDTTSTACSSSSSQTSYSRPPTPEATTLLSLPFELIERICDLIRPQCPTHFLCPPKLDSGKAGFTPSSRPLHRLMDPDRAKIDLSRLSRTCRYLHAVARPRLFRSISCRPKRSDFRHPRWAGDHGLDAASLTISLIGTLQRDPDLGPAVRSLSGLWSLPMLDADPMSPRLLQHLPNLRHLSLSDLATLRSAPTGLTSLAFHNQSFRDAFFDESDVPLARALLSRFPNLSTVSIGLDSIFESRASRFSRSLTSPSITRLSLRSNDPRDPSSIHVKLSTIVKMCPPNVTHLHLAEWTLTQADPSYPTAAAAAADAEELAVLASSTLEILEFPQPMMTPPPFDPFSRLDLFPSLRTVRILLVNCVAHDLLPSFDRLPPRIGRLVLASTFGLDRPATLISYLASAIAASAAPPHPTPTPSSSKPIQKVELVEFIARSLAVDPAGSRALAKLRMVLDRRGIVYEEVVDDGLDGDFFFMRVLYDDDAPRVGNHFRTFL